MVVANGSSVADANTELIKRYVLPEPGDEIECRIYTVNVEDSKQYFLQTLLFYVGEADSFKEIRTVEEQVYPTF